jgi:hypothetical protein
MREKLKAVVFWVVKSYSLVKFANVSEVLAASITTAISMLASTRLFILAAIRT